MNAFLRAYSDLNTNGQVLAPRGAKIKELEDYQMILHPINDRFTSFQARGLKLGYAKKEILWYCRGDRFDTSISDAAAIWKDIIDTDGGINSNYGQYLFKDQEQWRWVIEELVRDRDSRRAVMTLLNNSHLREDNKDVVCTYAIGFRIRANKLNMSIHMRSWDAIWGMTNDVFCFSIIYEMIYTYLKWYYPDLEIGRYVHTADSFHVYERHFAMLYNLVAGGMNEYYGVHCPRIHGPEEVEWLLESQQTGEEIADQHKFTKWLLEGHNE